MDDTTIIKCLNEELDKLNRFGESTFTLENAIDQFTEWINGGKHVECPVDLSEWGIDPDDIESSTLKLADVPAEAEEMPEQLASDLPVTQELAVILLGL